MRLPYTLLTHAFVTLLAGLMVAGCSKNEPPPAPVKAAEAPPAPGPNLTQTPDVGKLETVAVTTTGYGVSPAVAVNDALKTALQQVNGTTMSTSTNSMNVSLDVSTISNSVGSGGASGSASVDSIKAQGFAEQVVQRSRGAVTEFRVVTTSGPSTDNCVTAKSSMQQASQMNRSSPENASFDGKASGTAKSSDGSSISAQQAVAARANASNQMSVSQQASGTVESSKCEPLYAVTIDAKIAKFKAPSDSGKIRIVVAPLKSSRPTFNVGGEQVSSREILAGIRQQVIDALSQTGRFTILDREYSAEIQGELDMIASGQTPNIEFAKLGQALSADLIWVGVVNDFSYERHARQLKTSDRELVSYSGGWSVSQRLVNVATKQILQSTTLEGKAPSVGPTTMGMGIDKGAIVRDMESDIVRLAAEAIVLRTFPISVVEREGNTVVLSQGGKSLTPNARFRIFLQGKELKDPQTGQSLGNMESYCCDVVVERVTPTLAYGRLENVTASLDGVKPGALQVRESAPAAVVAVASAPVPVTTTQASTPRDPRPAAASATAQAAGSEPVAAQPVVKDKDW